MEGQRRKAVVILGTSAVLTASIAAVCAWGGYRLNMTPSYPLGLWRIEVMRRDARVGDVIFICPPKTPAFELARERGYLPRGLCSGGTGPLIKMVAALARQRVTIDSRVNIDGRRLDQSEVQAADSQGRALTAFAGGVVPPGHVFLHSKYSGSYDSRYFGPISADGILGFARPVFTFAP